MISLNTFFSKELLTLDNLTELFSFFTDNESNSARLTCRWWNNLLTKDSQVRKNVKANTDAKELATFRKKAKKLSKLVTELRETEEELEELSRKLSVKSVSDHSDEFLSFKELVEDAEVGLGYRRASSDQVGRIFDSIREKSESTYVETREFGGELIHFYQSKHGNILVETDSKVLKILEIDPGSGSSIVCTSPRQHSYYRFGIFVVDSSTVKISDDELATLNENFKTYDSFKEIITNFLNARFENGDWIYVSCKRFG